MVASMNIHKRFVVQFFIQIGLAFILLSLILMTGWAVIGFSLKNSDAEKDLSQADDMFFSKAISIQEEQVTFDEKLKKLAKNQNSQLIVLTENGDVVGSYNTDEQALKHIGTSELFALILKNSPEYSYRKLDDKNKQSYYLLLSKKNLASEILNEIKLEEVDWKNHKLNLSSLSIQKITEDNGWAQLIDSKGEVVDEYGAKKQPTNYSIEDIIQISQDRQHSIVAYMDETTKQSIIVGIHKEKTLSQLGEGMNRTTGQILVITFILLIVLLLLGTFWYARKFGVPLIMMMKWINNLGEGIYEQPTDLYQHPILFNKKGKLKKKYRLYKDFINTLVQLTETLKKNEYDRLKMTQTREEWISGISHDLKTPLASVAGYSQMLESENYSWSEKETREFAKVISEKSSYMMELLEDLTLTYRLRSQTLPIVKEEVELNEFIRRAVIHFINNPANNGIEFNYQPYHENISASVDPKWFQRIIDNLIANAIKYNSAGTTVTVSISLIEQHLIIINIKDDGIGMNSETLDKLFQRYYRGTNTSDTGSGTGLGMAITKQLVQLHNGSIQVKSTPNKGTTIRIILPIDAEKNDA